jgi:5-formyltetrahydrofolate cyclo-ligase
MTAVWFGQFIQTVVQGMHKTDIGIEKKQLRQQLQAGLRELSAEQRSRKSKQACANLASTPQFRDVAVVMMYLPLPYEVDISPAILQAWQLGKTVVVPKISWTQRHMMPVEITSLETDFSTEVNGIKNPVTGRPIPPEEIGLVVTPGLGFDRAGRRLGRGGAYYDKFFDNAKLGAVRCAVAFQQQIVNSIPVTEQDRSVNMLVTDEEVIYFNPLTEVK